MFGVLVTAQPPRLAVLHKRFQRHTVGGGGHHDGADAFAGARVGDPDDGDVGDGGMGRERILDLEGGDVLRVADDRVFGATGDADVAVRIDQAEIACAQPPVVVESLGVQRRIGVTEETLGALESQLPSWPAPSSTS